MPAGEHRDRATRHPGGFTRTIAFTLLGTPLATAAPAALGADPKPGGAVNVATIGKPPTLDAMESPAGMVGIISRHIFEALFT